MVSHWSLSDSMFPQVSRTLLSILAVLNNLIVWMVSIRPLTSKSSSPFNNHLGTVPKAPITISTIVTFIFHRFFFQFSSKVVVLTLFSLSFSFILRSAGTAKTTIWQVLFSPCLGDPFVCLHPIRVYVWSFSWTGAGLCIYNLFAWSNLNFLHISQWINSLTQLCRVLYSFCANFQHSLIMWLTVSSL